ncbi:LOW QUALITY PROTEIN: hypothetical protein ACHAWX_005796 [Stephanocyclus meneghinianus]
MFYVPKGDSDVCMVYNGVALGINECLFAPHFGLPVILYVLQSLRLGYYQADMDIGEMFPNFILGEQLHPYSGVDVTHIRTTPEDMPHHQPAPLDEFPGREATCTRWWERWTQNWMGLRDSPYRSIQMAVIAKLPSYGNKDLPSNPFQWECVVLNLLGQADYDSTYPWVYKRQKDGHIASDIFLYVDNGRPTGFCEEQCWSASQRFCSVCSHLGVQDASRKHTTPSQMPGPWAGSIIHTRDALVALVSQKKWDKTKDMIQELSNLIAEREDGRIPVKRLEQIWRFLIYVSRTYNWMPPYLKGLHLTIDSWREGCTKRGWKVKCLKSQFTIWEWEGEQWVYVNPVVFSEATAGVSKAPDFVTPVDQLSEDVKALEILFAGDVPSVSLLRATRSYLALYLTGDASGKEFGSAVWDAAHIHWESGNYNQTYQQESSNYWEADNLVSQLEYLEKEGRLTEEEVMVFTDNSTFKGCYYKGHSQSEKLSDIILRTATTTYRNLTPRYSYCWYPNEGSRDRGLSRGDLLEGMMKSGTTPWSFLPLSQSADDQTAGAVLRWIQSWWTNEDGAAWCGVPLKILAPEDWFLLHEMNQPHLWVPPSGSHVHCVRVVQR